MTQFGPLADSRGDSPRNRADRPLVGHRPNSQGVPDQPALAPLREASQSTPPHRVQPKPPTAGRIERAFADDEVLVAGDRTVQQHLRQLTGGKQLGHAASHHLFIHVHGVLYRAGGGVMQGRPADGDGMGQAGQLTDLFMRLRPGSPSGYNNLNSRPTGLLDRLPIARRDAVIRVKQRAVQVDDQQADGHGRRYTRRFNMDRKRLSQVQQQDLTESRLNDDFLLWMRTSGSNWLLAVLLIACAFLGWEWWKRRAETTRDAAWDELAAATTPAALRDLAARNPTDDALGILASLSAGDGLLASIQSGTRFDREATAADAALTRDLREQYLADADASYAQAQMDAAAMPGFTGKPLLVPALLGRAAVAECRGDFKVAGEFLSQAEKTAQPEYPVLATRAASRLKTLDRLTNPYPIPEAPIVIPPLLGDSTTTPTAPLPGAPSSDDALRTLIGGDSAPTPAAPSTEPTAPAPAPPTP